MEIKVRTRDLQDLAISALRYALPQEIKPIPLLKREL